MLILLERLHSFVLQGRSECHVFEAAPACTGGKVFKNCHHQVNIIVLLHLYNEFKSSLSSFIRSSQLPSTSLGRRAPGTTLIYSFLPDTGQLSMLWTWLVMWLRMFKPEILS